MHQVLYKDILLTWGDYGTSLITAVQLLRYHDDLVDVALAAGRRTFHAHKVVLCAASPFLLDLLKSTTCKHPVVMLAGVQAADLEALLEFVYCDEVSIDPSQLSSLLQAAHCLNIQGLFPSSGSHTSESLQHIVKTTDNLAPNMSYVAVENDKMYLNLEESEAMSENPTDSFCTNSNWNVNSELPSNESIDINNLVQSSVNNLPRCNVTNCSRTRGASDQPGTCPLCGAMLRQARNLRKHLVTSCKYRMGTMTNNGTTSLNRHTVTNMQHLDDIPIQNIERITSSHIEHLETKIMAANSITCAELLQSNVNIQSNGMS